MKIKIRKRGSNTAILISFDINSQKFESLSERSKFFEELYGRKQVIKREKKVYKYYREGLMDDIPHIKVDNSVFIVAMKQMQKMMEFFDEWEDKVMLKTFPVLLDEKQVKQLKKEMKNE